MNKICTSIEQSKKLIDLRIDVNTADMYYPNRTDYSKEYDSYLYYEEGCTVDACYKMIIKLKELKLL